ncbi:hypothetical protein BMETH_390_2 [methanotrophic bacterial endosymbiont of Bathymodiolus sp.]|nr:hypothetical protein BMETH_390_2 [methanotrophic bacterial endosymbiont of Bathymodiolus sp.]
MLGNPVMAASTGYVTYISISSGAKPSVMVNICTRLGDTSGNASTGKPW